MALGLAHTHWPEGYDHDPVRHTHFGAQETHSHEFYSDADYTEGRRYHAGKTLEFQGLYGGAAGRAFLEHLRRTEADVTASLGLASLGLGWITARAVLTEPRACCLADCQDGSCVYCQGWRRYWERVQAKAKRRLPVSPTFGKRRPLPPQQARHEAKQAGNPLAPARERLGPRYVGETLTEYTCGCVRNDRGESRLNCARRSCEMMSGTRSVKDQWRAGHVPAAPGCEWATAPSGGRCDDLALNEVWINERTGSKRYCDKHARLFERRLDAARRRAHTKQERDEGGAVQISDERLREIRNYGHHRGRIAAAVAARAILHHDAVTIPKPEGAEERSILDASLRRGFLDGLRKHLNTRINDFWWERRHRSHLDHLRGVRRGLAARKEGRVRPWSVVKKELGL